jgi:hypothetical protein
MDNSRSIPPFSTDVRLAPELSEAVVRVLRVDESLQDFAESAIRSAVAARHRSEDAFNARGDASWAEYQQSGVSFPVEAVLDEMRALTERRRQQLGL